MKELMKDIIDTSSIILNYLENNKSTEIDKIDLKRLIEHLKEITATL